MVWLRIEFRSDHNHRRSHAVPTNFVRASYRLTLSAPAGHTFHSRRPRGQAGITLLPPFSVTRITPQPLSWHPMASQSGALLASNRQQGAPAVGSR